MVSANFQVLFLLPTKLASWTSEGKGMVAQYSCRTPSAPLDQNCWGRGRGHLYLKLNGCTAAVLQKDIQTFLSPNFRLSTVCAPVKSSYPQGCRPSPRQGSLPPWGPSQPWATPSPASSVSTEPPSRRGTYTAQSRLRPGNQPRALVLAAAACLPAVLLFADVGPTAFYPLFNCMSSDDLSSMG